MITLLFLAVAVTTNTRTLAQTSTPLTNLIQYAAFPGGGEELAKFIQTRLEYPLQAREMGTEGNVIVRFCVSKNGEITNIRILQGLGFGCDEEVKRVLEAMPDWTPAVKAGTPVDTFVIMPVQFRLM